MNTVYLRLNEVIRVRSDKSRSSQISVLRREGPLVRSL